MTGFLSLDFLAGLASIAGLIFSVLAWQKAKDAATAARDAKDEIRKSNAEQELDGLKQHAEDLLKAAQKDELVAARLICVDLHGSMIQSSHRWREFFGETGSNRINEAAAKIKEVSISLSTRRTTLTADERDKTIEFCHDIIALLAEESGKMLMRLEGAKTND